MLDVTMLAFDLAFAYRNPVVKGHVGGFSETFEAMGRAGADIALGILDGKDPSTIRPRTNPENSYWVDYRALQRWNLSFGEGPNPAALLPIGEGSTAGESMALASWNVAGLPDGAYTLVLQAVDKAGQSATAKSPTDTPR